MLRLFALVALAAAFRAAPALAAAMATPSQHGIPPEAQAQAYAAPEPDAYQQWGYTGWNGLTKHWDDQARPNSQWTARSRRYIEANPPR